MRTLVYWLLAVLTLLWCVIWVGAWLNVRVPMSILYLAASGPIARWLAVPVLLLATRRLFIAFRTREFVAPAFHGWLYALGALAVATHLVMIIMGLELPFGTGVGMQLSLWTRPIVFLIPIIFVVAEALSFKTSKPLQTGTREA